MADIRSRVDARLEEILPAEGETPTPLHAAMRYSALAPGKRLRPALCLAAFAAAGAPAPSDSPALDAGCALELVHTFSLIHDDLPAIDNDDLRRGRPTCHVKFGEAMAILAGDALFALAFAVLGSAHPQPDRVAHCVRLLAQATGSHGLVGGEVLDILAEGGGGDLALLQVIHQRKTGALIAAACEMGAVMNVRDVYEDRAIIESLRQFGVHIGLAFQIVDDILNETSTPEQLGKATGSDRELGKLTYPALVGLEESRKLAEAERQAALACLPGLPGDTAPLAQLADYATARAW